MHVIDMPPVASTLLEAMRAVGYSFGTAMADIIDNSVSAGATEVDVSFSPYGTPYVSILDNGSGMDAAQLRDAMRHGSRNPLAERAADDLGRFGLGLKTASLSQCRRLTVITLKEGSLSGAIWDIDEVVRRQSWAMLELDPGDMHLVADTGRLEKIGRGTLVVWEHLDRVFAGEASEDRALQDRIDSARTHLGLVFHRFLESTWGRNSLCIRMNNVQIVPYDPYLRGSIGGQVLPRESLSVDGHRVDVDAYILPHVSRLSPAEIERAGGDEGLRKNQGFYIYRNKRLIIWGTWFRLARQEEMTKLARVMVDIPNALDHLWALDIKKSTAHPPEAVRHGLRRIVERIADRSRRVYTFRGRKSMEPGVVRGWERIEKRGGAITYRINRDHDLFNALRACVPEEHGRLLESFVQSVEQTFPVDALYADLAAERKVSDEPESTALEDSLLEMAQLMHDALGGGTEAAKQLVDRLHLMEPFARHPVLTARIKERIG